jgi:hypothetical protein
MIDDEARSGYTALGFLEKKIPSGFETKGRALWEIGKYTSRR